MRLLSAAGHEVHVVPTPAALRFVGRPTWEAISHHPVHSDVFDDVAEVRHVALGQQADLIVVAPATANSIAKLANGLSDDLLGTTVLASHAPLLLAPAMHTEMWEHPATRANIAVLLERGVSMIGPESGQLTGSDIGIGRMSEAEAIARRVEELLHPFPQDFAGQRVLISAGGTREALDPVRFIGNHSSGKQGIALAEAARARGAEVTLVLGTAEVPAPSDVWLIRAETTEAMREAMRSESETADLVIMAAAVADYRPATRAEHKLHKAEVGARFSLELLENPDILAELVKARHPGQFIVGFAAETGDTAEDVLRLGRDKLARKGCDLLVLNRVGVDPATGVDRVFGADLTRVSILSRAASGAAAASGSASAASLRDIEGDKLSVAHAILDATRSS